MASPEISFSHVLDGNFADVPEPSEGMDRQSTAVASQPSQSGAEAMSVTDDTPAVRYRVALSLQSLVAGPLYIVSHA